MDLANKCKLEMEKEKKRNKRVRKKELVNVYTNPYLILMYDDLYNLGP